MTPNDRERFAALITDVLGFYGQNVSRFALTVWWQACQPFDFETVQRALSRHATNPERGQFAPKPADLIREIQGLPSDRAARAWSLVITAASRIGAYTDVVFDDPIAHAVIEDMGGWPAICATETGQQSYAQHRFVEAYRAYAHRGDLTAWPAVMRGLRSSDDLYAAKGIKPPAPTLIGDPAKAARVMAEGGIRRIGSQTLGELLEQAVARISDASREDAA